MTYNLENKKVAVLVSNGFEEVEFTKPIEALRNAGAHIKIISPENDHVKAWAKTNWGSEYNVDIHIKDAKASEFDSLLLPGGVMNPDNLRSDEDAVSFIRHFFEEGKPIAAICHAPQVLIETGALEGRTLTSYPSIQTDLKNAGAHWVNEEVVVDQGLVTSRTPDDLPAFNAKMIEEFKEGIHEGQMTV